MEEFLQKKGAVITIGTFDGVHVGHRKIIKRLVDSGKKNHLKATVLTFFPHPRMVLQQESKIKLINTIEERKKILKKAGVEEIVVYPFTKEFSRLTAQEYVQSILVKKLQAKRVIIGYDHRFGRNRTADIQDLRKLGKQFHFEVEEISKEDIEEVAVSSTKIRKALENGELEKANTYLSEPFMLTGKIVKGKGLGKQLGYPTANLQIEEEYKLIPKGGVYVVSSVIDKKKYYGMMNIGTNPTVGGKEQTIETYFFDLDKNLYGKEISINLITRIRDEQNFNDVDELISAMKEDEEYSFNYLKKHKST
ncbi:bifunctional riboflavin kinase/FAD synthetase [Mesonia maritima]|uniref:Riboflavin biosynthesis protein n=1 Tax=Mesonia maritima TaxID=1793873 RepID=A0ABU1K2U2_9FLAO|nr:bifunctional riboflavin kinase/FAD synthetase [Mesonia maritima]MDR6299930.1 riboflavin kinase/FMN adenylyltransferase [Mesonia maritima]